MSTPSEIIEDDAAGGASGARRRRMMLLLGIGASLLALAGGGWFGYQASRPDGGAGKAAALASDTHGGTHDGAEGAGQEGAAAAPGLLEFKDLVVNISGSSATGAATQRILRIRFALAYDDPARNAALMTEKQPFLRDAMLGYLRQLHEADLRGSDGLFLLKAELLKRARAVVGNAAPREILITDLVMQ